MRCGRQNPVGERGAFQKCPHPAAGEQFLGHLGDQIPTRRVPHSLSAVMLGLDWPKELGKKLVRRAETPDVG